MQIEKIAKVLEQYANELNEGIALNNRMIRQVSGLHTLPEDYLWLMSISNGIRFHECTIINNYESDETGFSFGEFFSWKEVVRVSTVLNEVLEEYNIKLQFPNLLYVGGTYENKSILIGTDGQIFGNVFIFSPVQMFDYNTDETVPVYKLTDSLEEFLLNLKPLPFNH
jgi:hypothetical protein